MKRHPSTRSSRSIGARTAPLCLLSLFLLGACAVEAPTGPSIPVMPGEGKSLGQFQQDDATCRQFASQQTGGASPAAAANQAGVGSAVVGTAVGAAAGAAIGAAAGDPAAGAAIGAGAGLLTGTAAGFGNAAASADNVQQRYDIAYEQCMTTTGNKPAVAAAPQPVYSAPAPAPVYAAPAYPAYPYYYYPGYYYPGAYYYGPAYYGPGFYPSATFVFGFHGGNGHGYYHHH